MPNPRLADRYAKSLIDLATERSQLDIVRADMQYFSALCKASNEFVNMLRSPIIKSDSKEKIILAITTGNINAGRSSCGFGGKQPRELGWLSPAHGNFERW